VTEVGAAGQDLGVTDAPASNAGLAVRAFGEGPRVAIALHGITASAMAWPVVARALPADWTVLAPDLRGRGASAGLPGPYGLDRHADDVCALARVRGAGVVLARALDGCLGGAAGRGGASRAVHPAGPH
jgi:pimeloyl-ACP methyl ester carboxylesterase